MSVHLIWQFLFPLRLLTHGQIFEGNILKNYDIMLDEALDMTESIDTTFLCILVLLAIILNINSDF